MGNVEFVSFVATLTGRDAAAADGRATERLRGITGGAPTAGGRAA